MTKKTPSKSKKPQVSEEIAKLKSELSEKDLDQAAGGYYPLLKGRTYGAG